HLVQHVDDQADVLVLGLLSHVALGGAQRDGKADEVGAEDAEQPDQVPTGHGQPSSRERAGGVGRHEWDYSGRRRPAERGITRLRLGDGELKGRGGRGRGYGFLSSNRQSATRNPQSAIDKVTTATRVPGCRRAAVSDGRRGR